MHVHRRPGEQRPCAWGWRPGPMLGGALWEEQPHPWRGPPKQHLLTPRSPVSSLSDIRETEGPGQPSQHLPSAASERDLQAAGGHAPVVEGQRGTPRAPPAWGLLRPLERTQGSTGSGAPADPCPHTLVAHPHGALPRAALCFYGPCRLGVRADEQDTEFPAIRWAGRAHGMRPSTLVTRQDAAPDRHAPSEGTGTHTPPHPALPWHPALLWTGLGPAADSGRPLPSRQHPCLLSLTAEPSRWRPFTCLRGQKVLLTLYPPMVSQSILC